MKAPTSADTATLKTRKGKELKLSAVLIACVVALSGSATHAQEESPVRQMKWNIDLQIRGPDKGTESFTLFDDGKVLHIRNGSITGQGLWSGITSSENAGTIYSNVCELSPGYACELAGNSPMSTDWLTTAVCVQVTVSVGERTTRYEECVKEMTALSPQLSAVVQSIEKIVATDQKMTE